MPQVLVSIQSRLMVMRDQQGQTMAEYGVVLAVITLVVVAGLMMLAGGINGALEEVSGIF
jgi:Flp pilus assembly pilin Flp